MTSLHKRLIPTLLLLILSLLPALSRAEPVDRIVAIVNDEAITSTELAQRGEKMYDEIRRSTPSDKLEAALVEARNKLLENMIDYRLIIQKAKEMKFEITPEDVDSAIARLEAENNLTHEQLIKEVAKEGFSEEEYKKFTADQLRRSRLINYEVASRIVIGEDRVKKYYDNVYLKETPPPGYHLLQMGFRWDTDAASTTGEEAHKRAERIRKLVEEGQDFRELAHSFSELPSAKDGGDLGTLKPQEMTEEMRKLLHGLTPGQLSRVEENGDTVQFFQVMSVNNGGQVLFPPFAMVKDQIRDRIFKEEMDKRLENWMKELREQAIIKKLL